MWNWTPESCSSAPGVTQKSRHPSPKRRVCELVQKRKEKESSWLAIFSNFDCERSFHRFWLVRAKWLCQKNLWQLECNFHRALPGTTFNFYFNVASRLDQLQLWCALVLKLIFGDKALEKYPSLVCVSVQWSGWRSEVVKLIKTPCDKTKIGSSHSRPVSGKTRSGGKNFVYGWFSEATVP